VMNFHAVPGLHQRSMVDKSHIDHPSTLLDCALDVGSDEYGKILDAVYLSDDVVALLQAGQYRVQTLNSRTCPLNHHQLNYNDTDLSIVVELNCNFCVKTNVSFIDS
jgi:hypothetical protein